MKRFSFSLYLLLAVAVAGAENNGQTTTAQQARLPAPVQLFPGDNARLPDLQEITFKWSKVPGAVRYAIQIDGYYWGWTTDKGANGRLFLVDEPSYTSEGHTRLASWRVWAIDNQGNFGDISEWLVFTAGDPTLIIPPPPSSGRLPAGFPPLHPAPPLPAPEQITPAKGARMSGYPRDITFTWSKIPGASRYGIEIAYYGPSWSVDEHRHGYITSVKDPSFSFQFVGDQPGAWRIWSIDQASRPGKISEWSLFSFGLPNQPMPSPPSSAPPFDQLPIVAASTSTPVPGNQKPSAALASIAIAPVLVSTAQRPPDSEENTSSPDERLPAPENFTVTDTGPSVLPSGRPLSGHGVTFKWSPVPGASSYGIEIDPYGICAKKK